MSESPGQPFARRKMSSWFIRSNGETAHNEFGTSLYHGSGDAQTRRMARMVKTLDGDLNLLEGLEAAQELVKQRLHFKRGKWFLDRTSGRIDLTTIPQDLWSAPIKDAIRGVDCVTDVRNVKVDKIETAKRVRVTASVYTTDGSFELNEEIEP